MRDPAVMDPSISKVSSPESCREKGISSGRTLLQVQGVVYNVINIPC